MNTNDTRNSRGEFLQSIETMIARRRCQLRVGFPELLVEAFDPDFKLPIDVDGCSNYVCREQAQRE